MKTDYICTLDIEIQNSIKAKLIAKGITGEDLELAMNSRLCDLEEVLQEVGKCGQYTFTKIVGSVVLKYQRKRKPLSTVRKTKDIDMYGLGGKRNEMLLVF